MHRTLRALGAAAATVVLTGGLLGAGSAVAGTDPTMTGAPTVGTCFDITLQQAGRASLGEDPVACRRDHTAVVIGVDTLPERLDWDSPSEEIGALVSKRCDAAFDDRLGSSLVQAYRSQYQLFWFIPTVAQQEAGARWFDCVVTAREDRRLGDLPRVLPRLGTKLPDSVAKCATAKYAYTTCADDHLWRMTHAFSVTGKLTKRSLAAAAARVCPRHVSSRSYLRSAWDVPGKRFIVGCYTKTRR